MSWLLAAAVAVAMPWAAIAQANDHVIVCLRDPASVSLVRGATFATSGVTLEERLDSGVGGLPRTAAPDGGAVAPLSAAFDPRRIWRTTVTHGDLAAALAALRGDPGVAWAEADAIRTPQLWSLAPTAPPHGRIRSADAGGDDRFPDDPLFRDGRQWGLDNRGAAGPHGGVAGADIGAVAAWRASTGGNSVLLAIADTGIDPAHPEFSGALPDGRPRVRDALDAVAGGEVLDRYGHGTLVAGVAAARTGDGAHFDSLGIAGVCGGDGGDDWGCALLPIKVTPDASGSTSSFYLARALLIAVADGARAVNLSFAGAGASRLERLALAHAITHGCVPVAAAGNRGAAGAAPLYPAAYARDGLCIQVGASDPSDRRAPFSSYGPGLDVLAPGVDVWTTFMTYPSAAGARYPGYVAASGTSLAAPFVTGAVGVLAAARPALCDDDFQHVMRLAAHDLGAPGWDAENGWGRLDLASALAWVGPGVGLWHDEIAAQLWEPLEQDTLAIAEDGFGVPLPAVHGVATRVRVRATVTLPDSFEDAAELWVRVAGTTTTRGDFTATYLAPWAEATRVGPRRYLLTGHAFVDSTGGAWPFPLDLMRFGFTVLGRVRPPALGAPPARAAHAWRAAPNPFRARITLFTDRAARELEIFAIDGRRVRRARLDDSVGRFLWRGDDDEGRPVPPGVYFARTRGARRGTLRLLKLE